MSNEAKVLGEEPYPVAPDRTFEIMFEMSEPVGGFDESGSASGFRPSELYSVE
jgi:hypothetical protein